MAKGKDGPGPFGGDYAVTLDEWMRRYWAKTGEHLSLWPGAEFIFDGEKGFCVFITDGPRLIIGEVCGDGRYWFDFLVVKAKELDCDLLRFWTKRNPAAFTRKFGFALTGFFDGRFIMEKEV